MTIPADDFPPPSEVVGGDAVTVPASVVADVDRRVARFASKDASRTALQAVRLLASGGMLEAMATDAYTAVVYELPVEGEIDVRVPAPSLREFARTARGEVEVRSSGERVSMSSGGLVATMSQVAGTYPDIHVLFPSNHEAEATVSADDVRTSLGRVSVICDGNVRVSVGGGELVMSGGAGGNGEIVESVAADTDGEAEVALACKRLDEIMSASFGEVTIGFTSPTLPVTAVSYGEDGRLSCLLSPVRG